MQRQNRNRVRKAINQPIMNACVSYCGYRTDIINDIINHANGCMIITSATFYCNNLGEHSIEHFIDQLSAVHNIHLSRLIITTNRIGNPGAIHLSNKFLLIHNIVYLDLSGNKIGNSGAIAISSSFNKIESLILDDNRIGVKGTVAILIHMKERLKRLDLANNRVSDLQDIAKELMDPHHSLEELDLADNRYSSTFPIIDVLTSNHNIVYLKLDHDDIILHDLLRINKILRYDLPIWIDNQIGCIQVASVLHDHLLCKVLFLSHGSALIPRTGWRTRQGYNIASKIISEIAEARLYLYKNK